MRVFTRSGFIYLAFMLGVCQMIGCKIDDSENFQMPTVKEYNQIIAAIINQDTAFINQEESNIQSNELKVLAVTMQSPPMDSSIPPPIEDGFPFVSFSTLNEYGLLSPVDKRDSFYLDFQIKNMKPISMDTSLQDGIYISQEGKVKFSKLIFSVPVFNCEKDKVFVQAKLANDAVLDYLLYRVNNKWILINTGVKRVWHCG